jgi:hypothetical protein
VTFHGPAIASPVALRAPLPAAPQDDRFGGQFVRHENLQLVCCHHRVLVTELSPVASGSTPACLVPGHWDLRLQPRSLRTRFPKRNVQASHQRNSLPAAVP